MNMRIRLKVLSGFLAILLVIPSFGNAEDRFSFVALGDMPYGAPEIMGPPYERLIASINKVDPAFTIHIGDIKSGSTVCSDEEFNRQRAYFDSFAGALIYTPGDNEWTDCHRERAGAYEPLERLAALRAVFYGRGAYSLGSKPMALERQSSVGDEEHQIFVENQRWMHNGVFFMTAHIVGSNNGFQAHDADVVEEFFARTQANRAWIEAGFALARDRDVEAIVLAIHANVFEGRSEWTDWPQRSGFTGTMLLFRQLAEEYGKPVLLIHGDSHVFRIDQPFTSANRDKRGTTLDNVTRLEVFGASDVHAVRILVDPNDPAVFGFAPLYGPGNRSFSDD